MYRPIPGFYAQFAFMNELDRKRRINVFPITLAPFAAKWEDVIYSLMHLKELETGVEISLDNGIKTTICAPCIAFIGDMPQQQANAGCKNQKADHYCRSCLISSKYHYKNNADFDIVANGRYHFETERVRQEALTLPKRLRDKLFTNLGLSDNPSPLSSIFKTLCIPLAFPGDVAHSEFKGIARQVLNILFTDILRPVFHEVFARQFAATKPPPTWPQVQNIHKYIGSYSMQEYGRASMITPVALRKWLGEHHLRAKVPAAIGYIASKTNDNSSRLVGVDFLVHCYATIARMNAVVMGPYIRKEDRINLDALVREARRRMQYLVDIAVTASKKEVIHLPTARSETRSTSPLGSELRHSSRARTPTYKAANVDSYDDEKEDEYAEVESPLFGEEEEAFLATIGRTPTNKRLTKSQQEEKRLDCLQRKKYTPNVHTILHVVSTVDEYASARNVTTWSGEDKHRTFKDEITKTHHRMAITALLKREQKRQTIHLILGGAFHTTHAKLSACFLNIDVKCPNLIRYLTTPGTRLDRAQDNDGNDMQAIEADKLHLESVAQKRIYPKSTRLLNDTLLCVRTVHNLAHQHRFIHLLRNAYRIDYNISPAVSFDRYPIQWAERMRFLDPKRQRVITAKLSNFIRVRESKIGKIVGIFTHRRGNLRRLFAVVTLAEGDFKHRGIIEAAKDPMEDADTVLFAPTFSLTDERIIVGLPSIDPLPVWVTPAKKDDTFWLIDYDIYFM